MAHNEGVSLINQCRFARYTPIRHGLPFVLMTHLLDYSTAIIDDLGAKENMKSCSCQLFEIFRAIAAISEGDLGCLAKTASSMREDISSRFSFPSG